MIKAYLVGIPTLYEGESIEVRYSIFDGEELVNKKSILLGYKKPAVVGHVAMMELLKELEKYKNREILVIINDGALYETINGTCGTKNKDVIKAASNTRTELRKFADIDIKNISGIYEEIVAWDEILRN
jgi:TusA-related sulfurtransferase